MPEDLKLSQIDSSQPLPPPFGGLHSTGVRRHCQLSLPVISGNRLLGGPLSLFYVFRVATLRMCDPRSQW